MDKIEKEERLFCCNRCTDSCCCSEPIAKRTRLALRKTTEVAEECDSESPEPTILDVLNEDCWWELFQYLSVDDLVLSERVSQRWRQVVRHYLQGIRLCVRSSRYNYNDYPAKVKCRVLRVHPYYYMDVIERFTGAIVAADCFDAPGLRYLEENCPDIEDLSIHEPRFHLLKTLVVRFEKLKRLTFRNASHLKDAYVAKFLSVNTPEELVIINNVRITGYCLSSLQKNLKSLQLHSCEALDIFCLLDAVDRLSELTELRMYYNSLKVLEDVFMLIECTPKLEYLGLDWYTMWSTKDVDVGGLVDAICGLKRLRQLSLHDNDGVKDDWLEAFGRCLPELQVVRVGGCRDVTAAGVTALCRGAGNTLVELDVSGNDHVTAEDVVCWINMCPKLQMLDLDDCRLLTRGLPAALRGALPRGRRLRLRLGGTDVELAQPVSEHTYRIDAGPGRLPPADARAAGGGCGCGSAAPTSSARSRSVNTLTG